MKVVFCTHLRGVYTSLFRSTQHPMLMDFAAEFERLALSFFEPCDRAADNLSIIGREYEPDVSRSTSLRTSAYMVSYDRYQWIIPRVVTIPKLTRIYILAVLSQRSNDPNPTKPPLSILAARLYAAEYVYCITATHSLGPKHNKHANPIRPCLVDTPPSKET
jgi:hypothetical protein